MGRFDDIDLGGDKAMSRMVKKAQEERKAILQEVVDFLLGADECSAAEKVKKLKDEVGR